MSYIANYKCYKEHPLNNLINNLWYVACVKYSKSCVQRTQIIFMCVFKQYSLKKMMVAKLFL